MPRYTVSFVDASGARRREPREAASVDEVFVRAEQGGARDVVVHGVDILPAEGRNLALEAQRYESWRRKSTSGMVWQNAGKWLRPIGVIVLWAAVLRWLVGGSPAWIYAAAALGIAWAALAVTPLAVHARIRRALTWRDFRSALLYIRLLSLNPRAMRTPSMRLLMAFYRAKAIAGLGRLPDGLALFEAAAIRARLPRSRIDSMKASICTTARDHDAAIAFYRRAVADPAHQLGDIDLAISLVRRKGDVEGAKQALAALGNRRITEKERAFRLWADALIAVEEKRFDDALASIEASQQKFVAEFPASMSHDLYLLHCVTSACRCSALAGLGRMREAIALFEEIRPFLDATQEHELLAQCRRALEAKPLPYRG